MENRIEKRLITIHSSIVTVIDNASNVEGIQNCAKNVAAAAIMISGVILTDHFISQEHVFSREKVTDLYEATITS